MLTRKINNTILIASHIAKFMMQMGFAVLLAKLIWWTITPAYNEVYVDHVRINQKDTSVKYIINRYPFGEVVVIQHKDEAPLFSSLVKLHGVYVNGDDSMAFLNYSGKSQAVKLGGNISSDIVLTKIEPDAVVITQNGIYATIKITKSDDMPNLGGAARSNSMSLPSNGNMNNNDGNNSNNDLMEKRRELINKFSKQETQDNSNNTGASNRSNDDN